MSDADLAYLYGVPEAELDLDAIAGAPNPSCRQTDCRLLSGATVRAAEWLEKAPAMPLLLITRGAQVRPPTHQAPSCSVEQKTQPAVPCAQGTVAYRPGKPKIAVALDPVVVSDTVGAGDSYMGAFLVSLREKGALEKGVLAKMVRPNPAPSCRCILCDVGESIFVPAGGRVAGGDDGVRGEGGSGDVHKGGRRPADPRRGVLNGPLLLPLLRTTRLVAANAATLASPGKCFGEALTCRQAGRTVRS